MDGHYSDVRMPCVTIILREKNGLFNIINTKVVAQYSSENLQFDKWLNAIVSRIMISGIVHVFPVRMHLKYIALFVYITHTYDYQLHECGKVIPSLEIINFHSIPEPTLV